MKRTMRISHVIRAVLLATAALVAAAALPPTASVPPARAGQAFPPTHVVIVFDTTRSFWVWQHVAYAITERLLQELYFTMPGHPEDGVTFIVMNAMPAIVAELSGLDLRRRATRAFLDAYRVPDPNLGTDVVGALELADLALSRTPEATKFLWVFSDMRVDPARQPGGRIVRFRHLSEFDWGVFADVSTWIFLCPAEVELQMRREIPTARTLRFFGPPAIVGGVVPREALKGYVARITTAFQNTLAARRKAAGASASAEGPGFLRSRLPLLLVLIGIMVVLPIAYALAGRIRTTP